MDDHNDEEESRANAYENEALNSDSDDAMEVDCVDDKGVMVRLDGELVDSDINVDATELTSSDVDLSDESDIKGDLTSDEEGSPSGHHLDDDSDEETFALEMKEAKDDSSDEKYENEENDQRIALSKNTSEPEEDEEADEYDNEDEDSDNDTKPELKSTEHVSCAQASDPSDEPHQSISSNENLSDNSSPKVVQESEITESKIAEGKSLANSESPTTTQHERLEEDEKNVENSAELPTARSNPDEEDNNERQNASPNYKDTVLDGVSSFIGFDSEITSRTKQIFYILQQSYQDLLGQLQTAESQEENRSAMEVDTEQSNQPSVMFPELASPVRNENAAEEISHDKQSDEQTAANKRIKKKRKFFDEFDENETDPPKKFKQLVDDVSGTDTTNTSENKENFVNSEKGSAEDEPITASVAVTTPSVTVVSSPNPQTKAKTKDKFDISNPDFKEPFKYGWRREVVYRFISEDGQKKSADISYFTPQGKKLRSIKQINDNLPKDGSLSIKNFTFSKELIFRNRESELEATRFTKKMEAELLTNESNVSGDSIIDRRLGIEPIFTPTGDAASLSGGDGSAKKSTGGYATMSTPQLSSKKKEPQKSKTNAKTTPSSHGSETATKSKSSSKKTVKSTVETDSEEVTNATPKQTMPKIMLRGPNMANSNAAASKVTAAKPPGMKIKIGQLPPKQGTQKIVKKAPSSSLKSSKNSKSQKRVDKSSAVDAETTVISAADRPSYAKSVRGTQTCSISCPSALGTIPTLQCSICLCLYHFECCGMDADRPVYGYVCKTCRMCETKKENVQPTYNAQMRGGPTHYDPLMLSNYVAGGATTAKIVDGVTTWLPSSSNIHLKTMSGGVLTMTNTTCLGGDISTTTSPLSELQTPLVQGVLELEGRRYVVVPKQSVLSVSPNAFASATATATTLCERTTNTLIGPTSSVGVTSVTNTLLVNPSDVNNAGVVLVPVVSSSNKAGDHYNLQHMPNSSSARYAAAYENYDRYNRLKYPVENTSFSTYAINCNSINGSSPNELGAYQSVVGNRASQSTEYHSSFTLSNICRIYEPLLMSLKYLTVRDLLRISMTSKFLNRIASEPCLWKTVRLKNSQVHDWKGFAKALQKYGTKRLDMRKMLCSTVPEELNKMWEEFLEEVPSITSLEHIDFSRTPMNVVDIVAATCPNLAVFNALYLKNGSLTLDNFACLKHLVELRLKGVGGIELKRNEPQLHFINKDNLREISLTCVKNIDMDLLKTVSEACNLVTLELGDCAKLPSEFANEIGKLRKLEKLRLEKLDNLAPNYELLSVIKGMEALKSLELINIEIKDGFDQVLAQCKNIENFLIIPLYIAQSATTNQLLLDGIKSLSETLKCFVWGLTTELLKVTDLFMDQWQPKGAGGAGANSNASNKKTGDSIPVRKLVDEPSTDGDVAPTHIDILPIPKLERILATNLPNSRIKVIKVPFHMTWRQSLAECMK